MAGSTFLYRLKNWEYWPSWLTNIPVVGFWLLQAARTGHLFFFSTVNPAAMNGGMLGNSKMKILESIPEKYLPLSARFENSPGRETAILDFMEANQVRYPVILKPDIGERGLRVQRIKDQAQLDRYLSTAHYDLILQEYVDYPLEVTILCYQIPGTDEAGITSVCSKEFLQVTGDGRHSIRELIRLNRRARLYEHVLAESWSGDWDRIPGKGERVFLQPIGNHCKGTKFLNANDRIDTRLTQTFTNILKQMPGFNYGRFDLRCHTWELLKEGKDFKILEFNGVNSEPAHVYDPAYPTWKRYRDFYRQWALMARIARVQTARGIKPLKLNEAGKQLKQYFQYLQAVKSM